jgi:hypothetical protein
MRATSRATGTVTAAPVTRFDASAWWVQWSTRAASPAPTAAAEAKMK